jgi:hypothetical protein
MTAFDHSLGSFWWRSIAARSNAFASAKLTIRFASVSANSVIAVVALIIARV